MSIVSADPSELETLRSRLIADSNSLSKIGLPDSPDASSTGSDDLASACEDFLSNAKNESQGVVPGVKRQPKESISRQSTSVKLTPTPPTISARSSDR